MTDNNITPATKKVSVLKWMLNGASAGAVAGGGFGLAFKPSTLTKIGIGGAFALSFLANPFEGLLFDTWIASDLLKKNKSSDPFDNIIANDRQIESDTANKGRAIIISSIAGAIIGAGTGYTLAKRINRHHKEEAMDEMLQKSIKDQTLEASKEKSSRKSEPAVSR